MSTSRWLTWTPSQATIQKSPLPVPSKPPKVVSEGFGGSTPAIFPIIEQSPAEAESEVEPAFCVPPSSALPGMPEGVRLVAWQPQKPPVAITSWSVVIDVALFIQTTLWQLDAALRGDHWRAGNWSARTLVERLEQVGVKIELLTM